MGKLEESTTMFSGAESILRLNNGDTGNGGFIKLHVERYPPLRSDSKDNRANTDETKLLRRFDTMDVGAHHSPGYAHQDQARVEIPLRTTSICDDTNVSPIIEKRVISSEIRDQVMKNLEDSRSLTFASYYDAKKTLQDSHSSQVHEEKRGWSLLCPLPQLPWHHLRTKKCTKQLTAQDTTSSVYFHCFPNETPWLTSNSELESDSFPFPREALSMFQEKLCDDGRVNGELKQSKAADKKKKKNNPLMSFLNPLRKSRRHQSKKARDACASHFVSVSQELRDPRVLSDTSSESDRLSEALAESSKHMFIDSRVSLSRQRIDVADGNPSTSAGCCDIARISEEEGGESEDITVVYYRPVKVIKWSKPEATPLGNDNANQGEETSVETKRSSETDAATTPVSVSGFEGRHSVDGTIDATPIGSRHLQKALSRVNEESRCDESSQKGSQSPEHESIRELPAPIHGSIKYPEEWQQLVCKSMDNEERSFPIDQDQKEMNDRERSISSIENFYLQGVWEICDGLDVPIANANEDCPRL